MRARSVYAVEGFSGDEWWIVALFESQELAESLQKFLTDRLSSNGVQEYKVYQSVDEYWKDQEGDPTKAYDKKRWFAKTDGGS